MQVGRANAEAPSKASPCHCRELWLPTPKQQQVAPSEHLDLQIASQRVVPEEPLCKRSPPNGVYQNREANKW